MCVDTNLIKLMKKKSNEKIYIFSSLIFWFNSFILCMHANLYAPRSHVVCQPRYSQRKALGSETLGIVYL